MKKEYLKLYYKWLEHGMPGNSGVCQALACEGCGYGNIDFYFFGDGSDAYWNISKRGVFDDVRQNCILLMAAINNEL